MNWLLFLQITDLALATFVVGFLVGGIITAHPRIDWGEPPEWVVICWLFAVGLWAFLDVLRILNGFFHWI